MTTTASTDSLRGAVERQKDAGETATTAGGSDGLYAWLQSMQSEIAKALPKHLTPERLARIILTEVRKTPLLARCTKESFAGAVMVMSQLGLEPGSATGEAYLIPFRNGRTGQYEVQLVIGYLGMAKLFWQHPLAASLDAEVVHKNDHFEYEKGLTPRLVHRPAEGDRGPATHYYAVARLTTGGSHFVVLTKADVEAIRDGLRQKPRPGSPWVEHFDAMGCKSAVRRVFKLMPRSAELIRALDVDDDGGTVTASQVLDLPPRAELEAGSHDLDVDPTTGEILSGGAADQDDEPADGWREPEPPADAAAGEDPPADADPASWPEVTQPGKAGRR